MEELTFDQWIDLLEKSKPVLFQAIRRAVSLSAMEIEGDAKALAPVDTGRLRGSIGTTLDVGKDYVLANVGTVVEYAVFVEYGTGKKGEAGVPHRQDWLGMPPHPYLRPSFRFHVDSGNIEKIFTYTIEEALKSIT